LRFDVIDSLLQELLPWNFEEFKKISVFQTFFAIFAALQFKLGLLLCSKDLLTVPVHVSV
jgi:hypothetical protein